MSASNQAKTNKSSQMPQSRAPPRGSNASGSQQQQSQSKYQTQSNYLGQSNAQGQANSQGENNIPSSAVTSSTSRPQRSTYPDQEGGRKSNVVLGKPAPSVAPSDSISRIKTRSTWPGPNSNSDRKGTRNPRTPGGWSGSQASRTSSQNGVAWSGSGAALTENNLEKLNEEQGPSEAGGYSNQAPRSDQQEALQSASRSIQRNGNATTNGGTRASGQQTQQLAQQTSRRSSGQSHQTQNNYYAQSAKQTSQRGYTEGSGNKFSSQQPGAAAGAAVGVSAGEAADNKQSKKQTVAASRNAIDANAAKSRGESQAHAQTADGTDTNVKQTSGRSQSKTASQSRSRRDSKFDDGEYAITESQNANEGRISGPRAPWKPASAQSSPTSPTQPELPNGWEKKTRIITKRYPDGREVRETEISVQPVGDD